jgi:hypothetical protein
MRRPRRELFGYTWVGWLNMLLLQWACVRLGYTNDGGWRLLTRIRPGSGWSRPFQTWPPRRSP